LDFVQPTYLPNRVACVAPNGVHGTGKPDAPIPACPPRCKNYSGHRSRSRSSPNADASLNY
jgi:hypothetical protein